MTQTWIEQLDDVSDGNYNAAINNAKAAQDIELLAGEATDAVLSGQVRDQVREVLMDFIVQESPRTDPLLRRLLAPGNDEGILGHVLWRLEGSGNQSMIPTIGHLLDHPLTAGVKAQALITLSFFRTAGARQLIQNELTDHTFIPSRGKTVAELSGELLALTD